MDIKTILVPFDFGEPATHALDLAKTLADRFGSSLVLLHVVANPYMTTYLPGTPDAAFTMAADLIDDLVKEGQARLDRVLSPAEQQTYKARALAISGDPRREILEHATRAHADLIVMGTHGRTGAAHLFLGSVAERVVRESACPVLTVR